MVTESKQTASFVRNFNPLAEVGDVRWPTRRAMYEPLLIFNPMTGEFVPWLATSYAWSDDNRALDMTIRDGVRWSDGKPFRASDVAFTFGMLREHEALDLYGVWQFVEDVSVIDDATVRFTFVRPYVPGLYYIGHQPIVPAHVWRDVKDPLTFSNPEPVATGPFVKVSSFQGQSYRVERNPDYWQPDAPKIEALQFLAFASNEQTNLAVINGEVDWAGNFMPAIDRIYVGKNPRDNHYWFPLVDGAVFLYANTTRPPLDQPRVRKALSMSFDRELVVRIAMHGYTRPADATGLNDAYARFLNEDAVASGFWTNHDPDAARAVLDEVDLPPLELIVPAGFSDWVRAAQVIARSMRETGIRVKVKTYDFNAWFEKLQTGDFDLSLGWTDPGPTPYNMYRFLMATDTVRPLGQAAAENWHRLGLPEADALLAQIEATNDPAREAALLAELQRIFVDNAPALPLFPGPLWGQYSSARFTGFPNADDPYAPLSPHMQPAPLLVLTKVAPR